MIRRGNAYSEIWICTRIRLLWSKDTVAVDLIVAYGVGPLAAGVAGVTFYGVYDAVFDLFDYSDMVGDAVLAALVGVVPVEKDDVAGVGGVGVVLPLVAFFEPVFTDIADGEAGENTVFQVAAFIGTPTDEDCTLIYSLVKTVPSPVGFTAYIANLGEGNCDEITLTA